MHTGRSYRLPEFIGWTRRTIYVLIVVSAVPVLLYQLAGWHWLAIPWGVVFLLGTTVALSSGFKNVQTYNRMQEAQQVWSSIASSSRVLGATARDLCANNDAARSLVYRHLAWLAALRFEMRQPRVWENARKANNVEYLRLYRIPEREQTLANELVKYLPPGEAAQVLESRNRALQVLGLQSRATKELLGDGKLTMNGFSDLQKLIRDFQDLQGKSERIKDFPYPRQHAFINTLFVRIMCVLLPFGMIGEFERLNTAVDGWAEGGMVWLVIPLSLLVSWMYCALDLVGESTENPFEGGANDVPISRISQEVEIDLRELLGEQGVPAETLATGDIAM